MFIGGYVLGAPIFHESLQFRLIECVPGDNETLSNHIIEITNYNETCIKVNKTSNQGNEVYLYIAPQTENGVQLRITTDNCSVPLPDLHLTVCDDIETNQNFTEVMVTFAFSNISDVDTFIYDDNNNNDTKTTTTTTTEAFLYTGPTVYETLHHLDQDSDEEQNNITNAPSLNVQNETEKQDSSSEDKNE